MPGSGKAVKEKLYKAIINQNRKHFSPNYGKIFPRQRIPSFVPF